MQKEYLDVIADGFMLKEQIEKEIAILKRIHTGSVDVRCSGNTLLIGSDYRNMKAEVEITKDEIIQKVLKDNLNPKDAICMLLKEKICSAAHDYK